MTYSEQTEAELGQPQAQLIYPFIGLFLFLVRDGLYTQSCGMSYVVCPLFKE